MAADEFRDWVLSQDWYQTIELSEGLVTPGKVDSRRRLRFLEQLDWRDRRVLDVGCNSGAYCLWAKRHGAAEVVGVDIDERRLAQARRLAEHEGLDVDFQQRSLFQLGELGRFDIVLCFAVLTEVQDLIGGLAALAAAIGRQALVELSLAKPIAYLSRSRSFRKGYATMPRRRAVLELRRHKRGWMIDPSLDVLQTLLGGEFRVEPRGRSVRYQMVELERVAG
ncbi:MAG TPA: class I SAM-dependent methyltransferase [Candidatus Polarisedimenticolaceae bacterium]|nr:class I SAM-dependent methyltransferase [Candidatus Polarisedimenticolaceae bacterium]